MLRVARVPGGIASTVVLVLLAAGLARAGSAAGPAASPITAALPDAYLADHAQDKKCKDFLEPIWVSFLTYAAATVGDEWTVVTNSPTVCKLATTTAEKIRDYLPANDGGGPPLTISGIESYAKLVGRGTTDDPISAKHAPAGWKCFALPSVWGALAWSYAALDHSGVPGDPEFAQASGPSAGAGYCVKGAKFDASGIWHGGTYFWWAPDTTTCRGRYKLKEIPDPDNPGQTKSPPFPPTLFGDYTPQSC